MLSLLYASLLILSAPLSSVSGFPAAQQLPVQHDSAVSILRRFAVRSDDEREQLMAHATVRTANYGQKCWAMNLLFIKAYDWDIWQTTPSYIDIFFRQSADIFSAPSLYSQFPYSDIHIPDLSSQPLDTKKPSRVESTVSWNLSSLNNSTYHSAYHSLHEMYTFAQELATQFPQEVSIVPLGHSGQGREMFALEITDGARTAPSGEEFQSHDQNCWTGKRGKAKTGRKQKMGFLVMGAQHAREVSLLISRTCTVC